VLSEEPLFSDDLPLLKSRNGKRKVQDFETIADFRKKQKIEF